MIRLFRMCLSVIILLRGNHSCLPAAWPQNRGPPELLMWHGPSVQAPPNGWEGPVWFFRPPYNRNKKNREYDCPVNRPCTPTARLQQTKAVARAFYLFVQQLPRINR